MDYRIFWTNEALNNFESILNYLTDKWTIREINNFKYSISRQIKIIQNNPLLFTFSEFQPRLRKAVVSKQTTIFYEIRQENIFIVYLFVTHQNTSNLK